MFQQKTIKKEIRLDGIGVHSGLYASVTLRPLGCDSGINFVSGLADQQKICVGDVIPEDSMHATVIKVGNLSVSTIEHLMSALRALGIDNLEVEVSGGEMPILDGSALPFVQALLEAGIEEQNAKKVFISPREKIRFEDAEGRFIELNPAQDGDACELVFDYSVSFEHPLAGHGRIHGKLTQDLFIKEIAPARTFGFLNQLSMLRKHNLARGASLGNTVVIGDNEFINERRFEDEFVRHKFLDLIGDLACLGKPLVGVLTAAKTGHRFNRQVVEHFIKHPDKWKLI